MPTLHLLGTGGAFSDPHRTTTMLAVTDGTSTLVIDCGGDVVQRFLAASLDLNTLSALFLTHEHIDHVGGFPLFMERTWLAGRRAPIPVYGIAPALDQARRCFATFDTSGWEGLPEILWHSFPETLGALVLSDATWNVQAAPGIHSVPVVGLRIEHRPSGQVAAYSSDTQPSSDITKLAYRADLLLHEATGALPGHTTLEQAAEIAASAEAKRLVLVHLPPGLTDDDLHGARRVFPDTALGDELGAYNY